MDAPSESNDASESANFEADEQALNKFLATNHGKVLGKLLDDFITKLQREEAQSSILLTNETLTLLRKFVGGQRYQSAQLLVHVVRGVGRRLIRAKPVELVVGNTVRRVLFLIREECRTLISETSDTGVNAEEFNATEKTCLDLECTIHNENDIIKIFDAKSQQGQLKGVDLRPIIIDAINEVLSELENQYEPISKQALDHIHANETILVYGYSTAVFHFLQFAYKHNRTFDVFVQDRKMAKALTTTSASSSNSSSSSPVTVTYIPECAINAIMCRVNKVIISARSILANGGLVASAGVNMVCLSAKHYRVPVVCVTGLHKLCPLFVHDIINLSGDSDSGLVDFKNPGEVLGYLNMHGPMAAPVNVLEPRFDYVKPELVDLFVTNTGGHQATYVYRLLSEYYHPSDTYIR